jgi:hypothetical protein
VERRLAVAAARVHQIRIGVDQRTETVKHTEARRAMGRYCGPAFDRVGGKFGAGGIEQAESTCPPSTACVDISTSVKEHIEHTSAPYAHYYGRVKIADAVVNPSFEHRIFVD